MVSELVAAYHQGHSTWASPLSNSGRRWSKIKCTVVTSKFKWISLLGMPENIPFEILKYWKQYWIQLFGSQHHSATFIQAWAIVRITWTAHIWLMLIRIIEFVFLYPGPQFNLITPLIIRFSFVWLQSLLPEVALSPSASAKCKPVNNSGRNQQRLSRKWNINFAATTDIIEITIRKNRNKNQIVDPTPSQVNKAHSQTQTHKNRKDFYYGRTEIKADSAICGDHATRTY